MSVTEKNPNIEEILLAHQRWLCSTNEGQCANFWRKNLQKADLHGRNLSAAVLAAANLTNANLTRTILTKADLCSANLTDSNVSGADFRGALLYGANLTRVDLRDVNLKNADLRDVNLTGARLPHFQIPQTGTIEGWKKLWNSVICKVLVPAHAQRTATLISRKCRASEIVVLEGEGSSLHDSRVFYRVGATVRPTEPYDPDIRVDCTSGIHFFLTREEAEEY